MNGSELFARNLIAGQTIVRLRDQRQVAAIAKERRQRMAAALRQVALKSLVSWIVVLLVATSAILVWGGLE